jgi:tetraacyldisaccharide 4'-kinase
MHVFRRLLLPFSIIYGAIVSIRNYLYDSGKIESFTYSVPIICVGNLSTGGTGKTPLVEYLLRFLYHEYRIATLSRGYGRRTKGYIKAELPTDTHMIGDEPMQYLTKFKNITVAVSEDRNAGIQKLLKSEYPPQVIIMDDAFQHRKVKAGLNILLIEFDSVFKKDFLLPAGNLREPRSSANRADIIVITKSPEILVPIERKRILEKINAANNQHIFFSFVRYGEFNKIFGATELMQMGAGYYLEKRFTILLVTGIANPSGLIEYLRRHTDKLELLIFPDHHEFSVADLNQIHKSFDNIVNPSKIIVTTEKDAMRLRNPDIRPYATKLPFFFLPIEVQFHKEEEKFNELIKEYVRKNQQHIRIHQRPPER